MVVDCGPHRVGPASAPVGHDSPAGTPALRMNVLTIHAVHDPNRHAHNPRSRTGLRAGRYLRWLSPVGHRLKAASVPVACWQHHGLNHIRQKSPTLANGRVYLFCHLAAVEIAARAPAGREIARFKSNEALRRYAIQVVRLCGDGWSCARSHDTSRRMIPSGHYP